MKIAFKNFITTLRRYKMASVLNIAGLTLAFLAFYVIMSQVYYDVTYNRSIRDSDRTYILLSRHYDGWIPLESRINAEEALATWPEVECSGAIRKVGDGAEYVWVKRSEYNYDRYDYRTAAISLPLLDVLSFRTVEGDLRRLSEPGTVIISESLAERMGVHAGDDVYLPDMDAAADDPDAGRKPARCMTVAGVYADFAPNTMMGNVHMAMDAGDDLLSEDKRDWRAYTYYVKLREGASPEDMAEVWKRTIPYADDDSVMLVSVRDIYYWDALEFGGVEQGSKSGSAVLFGIAILIVGIAFINFVNFFFALIPVRMRAVNICKVFGASTAALRWNFLFESVGMVLCSLLLTLYLMVVVQDSFIAEYVTCSLAMSDNLPALALVLVITVAIALVSSLYPAWYITSFNASLTVKGGFAGSVAGRRMRLVLTGVQFIISIALIIVSAAFWTQYRYMMRFDMGFDRDNLLVFESTGSIAGRGDAFISHLEGNSDITAVTAASRDVIGLNETYSWMDGDRLIEVKRCFVRYNFFDVMGIPLIDGEGFRLSSQRRDDCSVVNRHIAELMSLEVGDDFAGSKVVGITDDVMMHDVSQNKVSLEWLCGTEDMRFFYVRVRGGGDIKRVCDFIRSSVREFDPAADEPSIEFVDQHVARLYDQVKRQTVLVSLFALLSVVISLMGVFGIVLFETQHRRREIAVRRVFGASTSGIIWMLNRRYALIVAVCSVVAAPVAWYVVARWMERFVNRTDISWLIYLGALALVLAITLALVTLRSWRAANENPSRVLGGE